MNPIQTLTQNVHLKNVPILLSRNGLPILSLVKRMVIRYVANAPTQNTNHQFTNSNLRAVEDLGVQGWIYSLKASASPRRSTELKAIRISTQ